MNYIIAIDQSTSSTKALLFDEKCRVVARTNVDHKQYYPQTGWVEHDAVEIYNNMVEAIRQLVVSSHFSPLTIPEQSSPTRSLSHLSPLRIFGGFEMIAAIGAMLRAAEQHLMILIDGFIMTACALAAIQLYPAAQDYMIFTHCGDESGHKAMLDSINAKPLLHLGLRLGEGTGALCAFPIIDSAVRMMNEMNNFDNAQITKYF